MNISSNFCINKKRHPFIKTCIGVVLLLIFVGILNIFSAPVRNFFYTISYPAQKVFWTAGESSAQIFGSVLNSGNLLKENETLKNENQKLISQIAFLQAITDANKAQTDASLNCQNTGFQLVMAGVTGLDEQDMVSINKGSVDGLAEGMPVINQQNVLFGKVNKVYKNFSQVMLISNKKSVINVKVYQQAQDGQDQPKEIDGVIKGTGDLKMILDLVTVDNNLNENDIIITSALEKTFPKDLLVGKISKVQKDDQKPFQQANIQPFFDIKNIDNLFVITNYKQTKWFGQN